MGDNPLRVAAINAATEALMVKRWDRDRDFAEHANHAYRAGCAICDRDMDLVVPVVLDAADAALRRLADPSDDDLREVVRQLGVQLGCDRLAWCPVCHHWVANGHAEDCAWTALVFLVEGADHA